MYRDLMLSIDMRPDAADALLRAAIAADALEDAASLYVQLRERGVALSPPAYTDLLRCASRPTTRLVSTEIEL